MILLAVILAILLFLLPGLVILLAWFAVILLFIGGLAALFARLFSYNLEYRNSLYFLFGIGFNILQHFPIFAAHRVSQRLLRQTR